MNGNQWRGFLTCCEKLADNGSAYVLLQLPESILEKAMGSFSEAGGRSLWKKVHDAAHAEKCPVPVYKGTRQVRSGWDLLLMLVSPHLPARAARRVVSEVVAFKVGPMEIQVTQMCMSCHVCCS